MQGEERVDRELLDAAALAGHLIPENSMFAFLAAHRAEVFPDEDFADLFPSGRGRPSIPVAVMAAVLTLQTLHDFSDRETAEAVCFDVRWKAAIGAPLDYAGFDPSTLAYWRGRIAKSGRPHRINEAIRKIVEQTGIRAGRRRRAVDSTILADAVATQDTVTQLVSAIRKVAREVPGAAKQVRRCAPGTTTQSPASRRSTGTTRPPRTRWSRPWSTTPTRWWRHWHPGTASRRPRRWRCWPWSPGRTSSRPEGSDGTDGRWRIARKVAEDRVISTVDPGARHTRKSGEARRDGYRAHLAADPQIGIITDEKLTKAAGQENSDPAVAEEFLAAEAGRGDPGPAAAPAAASGGSAPLAWYGDSAYGTGDLRGAIEDAGHQAGDQAQAAAGPGARRAHRR